MDKSLFLKLIKIWHPDTTTNRHTKRVYEAMSQAINRAYEDGDRATLEAIDIHGEDYLGQGREDDVRPAGPEAGGGEGFAGCPGQMRAEAAQAWYAWTVEPPRISYLPVILGALNPYLLPMSLSDLRTSRIYNLYTIVSGAFWVWIWWLLWKQLGVLEAEAQAAGFPHEGGVGLLFVLARAAMILSVLPIAVPMAVLAFLCGCAIGAAFISCWIVGGILGIFHPWLVNVPYGIAALILPFLGWKMLGDD